MNSREKLKRAIDLKNPDDGIPCCFMSFSALRKRSNEDRYDLSEEEEKMGLDPMLFIPSVSRGNRPEHPDLRGLPVHFHPEVKTEHRILQQDGNSVLQKTYTTPGGSLSTSIKLSDDWPHGKRIPFIDDYQIPRSIKPLITCKEDLEILKKYLLLPPSQEDVENFKKEYETAKATVEKHQVLLSGGWGVGLDMAFWLCGMQDLMVIMIEQPEFVKELLMIIHEWNLKRMEVVLSEGIDLYIRRAWYEGCEFVMPDFYEEAMMPLIRAEAELAHKYGARFGYICTSGQIPLLDSYLKSGIDVLIGIDPVQGSRSEMEVIKKRIGDKICLWGGVSAAITVERGNEKEVREAVQKAIKILGPSGFILSPVDNITIDEPQTWENIKFFIDEWEKQ